MSGDSDWYNGRRLSYDGALCTVRCFLPQGVVPGTKGDWLGVEWDDTSRGKHNGSFNGKRYFDCLSSAPTVASFVRPSRKQDVQRSVLEAIKHKYVSSSLPSSEVVVISGKIAEEIGFDKISKEQSVLEDLRIVLVDQLGIVGIAQRESPSITIAQAQIDLARTCPNIIELDLGYNPIETWRDVEDICVSLPQLRVLKLNCIRLCSFATRPGIKAFENIRELHLNQTLLNWTTLQTILGSSEHNNFPKLCSLWMSQNELNAIKIPDGFHTNTYTTVETLMLENNFFINMKCLDSILSIFPKVTHVSLQSNQVEEYDGILSTIIDASTGPHSTLQTLNLSQNKIASFSFIDKIPITLPNLTSLRISKNPVYEKPYYSTPLANPTETNYYLTLARIPSLKTLNYTNITPRERDEGEIYYLSVTEREIRALVAETNLSDATTRKQLLRTIHEKFPRYEILCQKHDRESILSLLTPGVAGNENKTSALQNPVRAAYSPGSLASRLVNATFYIASSVPSSNPAQQNLTSYTRLLSTTLPTSHIFALVSKTLDLPPLQFRLIFESTEFDPVRDDLTTRSRIASSKNTNAQGKALYTDWGDWDVDNPSTTTDSPSSNDTNTAAATQSPTPPPEVWTKEGYLLRDNRKWKRRETEILMGMRAWGDYLDLDDNLNDQGTWRDVKVRVESKTQTWSQ